jgi:hypothetical protein
VTELSTLTATQDALRRRRPDVLAALGRRFPELGLTAAPRRPLGAGEPVVSTGTREYADVAYEEARADLSEVLGILARRIKRLARLRLTAGIATTVSSGGLVALILGEKPGQLVVAGVAFVTSILSLYISYVEDFSGGDGSTKRMQEAMMAQTRRLAEAGAQLRMSKALDKDDTLLPAMTLMNEVFAEVQVVRAQLGLPL